MSKYKIGDVFVSQEEFPVLRKAEIVAFDKEGAILEVLEAGKGSGRNCAGDLVRKSDYTLEEYYTLVGPKPAFFEVGAFYRFIGFESVEYTRYEIKEIFATPQPDGAPALLQAHAEGVSKFAASQAFLTTSDFISMTKM